MSIERGCQLRIVPFLPFQRSREGDFDFKGSFDGSAEKAKREQHAVYRFRFL